MSSQKAIKPMLCHRYSSNGVITSHGKSIRFPIYVQPKLNGIRAVYFSETKNWQSHSRLTKEVCFWDRHILSHITCQLENLFSVPVILDGEMYRHGWPLQRINGAVSVKRQSTSKDTTEVNFHVFDIIADVPFSQRVEGLRELSTVYPFVVPTFFIDSESSANYYYSLWKRQGYEGLIYRQPKQPYGFEERCGNQENRWDYSIKRKDRSSSEFEIIGVTQGMSVHKEPQLWVGALRLVTSNGKVFYAGSGLTEDQKFKYWQHPPIGMIASIAYEMYSPDGIPLQPTVEQVHEDE